VNEYEMVYIVSPRLSSDEGERTTAWVAGLVRESGGEVLSTDVWGRRRLAYPIKHQFEGTYVYSTFRLEPSATVRIESQLGLSEDVLRHLIIRGIVEGGKPEAQSARLMAAGRPAASPAPPPPAAVAEPATGEAPTEANDTSSEAPAETPTEATAEAPDASSEAPAEATAEAPAETPTEASTEDASPPPEATAPASAPDASEAATSDAETTTEARVADASAPAEPEPARSE
jgi:small subunit ribosomal protein S6